MKIKNAPIEKKITVTRYLKKTVYLGEFGGTNSNITRNWTRFTQYDGKKYWPLVQRWSRKDDRQSNKTGFESEYDTNEISQKRKKKNEIFVVVSKSVPRNSRQIACTRRRQTHIIMII